MPAQPPRIPSPADLARGRRPPAPPHPPPPPPRSRRLAESEKERAQQALRALLTDPATDFTTLEADEFFAALRCAGQDGTVNAGLIAEVGRRLAEGTAAARELHQVLFVAAGAAGADDGWEHARGAAMAAVARRPHLAVEVVGLEAQRRGGPPMQETESVSEGGFTARASLARDGEIVEGQPCFDLSKKRASQGAAVSLLTALLGIPLPATEPTEPTGASRPGSKSSPVLGQPLAMASGGGTTSGPIGPAMSPTDLEAWPDHVVSRPCRPAVSPASHRSSLIVKTLSVTHTPTKSSQSWQWTPSRAVPG